MKSKNLFNSACRLLGLFNQNKIEWNSFKKTKIEVTEDFIIQKINDRIIAKKNKDFILADQIREELLKKGILIQDEKDKTNWKYK